MASSNGNSGNHFSEEVNKSEQRWAVNYNEKHGNKKREKRFGVEKRKNNHEAKFRQIHNLNEAEDFFDDED